MRRIIINFLFLLILTLPFTIKCHAEQNNQTNNSTLQQDTIVENDEQNYSEERFKAKVIKIIDEKTVTDKNGSKLTLQKILLKGISGTYKDKEIIFNGIDNNINTKGQYKKGETVLATAAKEGEKTTFTIDDTYRINSLYWLVAIFVLIVLLIGKWHGFKSLISLLATLFIIIKFVVPKIMSGSDPMLVTVVASFIILVITFLLVYGWNIKSRIAIVGTLSGVILTMVLSIIFTNFSRLTGLMPEETIYLTSFFQSQADFKGLLLASFVFGSLGVLDDIAITQVSSVEQLKITNHKLNKIDLYKKAMKIGIDHISSMINTLFLAYAGASFLLLLLFTLKQPPFETIQDVLNNEIVATEIVRTLVGSIGLILTVPTTTYIASYFYSKK